jgi:hypothetical protein
MPLRLSCCCMWRLDEFCNPYGRRACQATTAYINLLPFGHSVYVVFLVSASSLVFREIHGGKTIVSSKQNLPAVIGSFQIHIWTSSVFYGKEIGFIPGTLTNLGGSPRIAKFVGHRIVSNDKDDLAIPCTTLAASLANYTICT